MNKKFALALIAYVVADDIAIRVVAYRKVKESHKQIKKLADDNMMLTDMCTLLAQRVDGDTQEQIIEQVQLNRMERNL